MFLLTGTEQTGNSQHAFASQYISIILIIFTCIIWVFFTDSSFLKPALSAQKQAITESQTKISVPTIPKDTVQLPREETLSVMEFKDLFSESDLTVNENVADAILAVIRSHDVDAVIELKAPNASFNKVLQMNEGLMKYFAAKEAPLHAIKCFMTPGNDTVQARVSFVKLKKA